MLRAYPLVAFVFFWFLRGVPPARLGQDLVQAILWPVYIPMYCGRAFSRWYKR
jgi:hypothetical protein